MRLGGPLRKPNCWSAAAGTSGWSARRPPKRWPGPRRSRTRSRSSWRGVRPRSAFSPAAIRSASASAPCWPGMCRSARWPAIPSLRPSASRRRASAGRSRIVRSCPCADARSKPCCPALQPGARLLVLSADADDARQGGRPAVRARLRSLPAHAVRSHGRPARAPARDDGRGLRLRRRRPAEHHRDRGRGRAPGLGFWRWCPVGPKPCSSTTARSPSPRSAPSPWPSSRRDGASCCGISGRARVRSAIEWMLAHPANRAVGDRTRSGPRGAHPPQRRGARRARTAHRAGLGARRLCRAASGPMRLHRRRRRHAGCDRPLLRGAASRAAAS